ncbi:Protein NETWORKED 3A [Bienertia sinuspersici]
MKIILDVLEEYESPLQNADLHERRKERITEVVQDLCISYRALAEEHESLKTVSINTHVSKSSPCSNNGSVKDIDSNPESTVEDAEIECDDTTNEIEHVKRFAEKSVPKDRSSNQSDTASSDGLRFKFSRLVEENTQIQVELIRRNSEKRETIRKLQNQVSRLKAQNETLQRTLSYYDRMQQHIQDNSPRRKRSFSSVTNAEYLLLT